MIRYLDRRHTDCSKWDNLGAMFGSDDLQAMWVADMDFRCPDCVMEALRAYTDFGVFGYYKPHQSKDIRTFFRLEMVSDVFVFSTSFRNGLEYAPRYCCLSSTGSFHIRTFDTSSAVGYNGRRTAKEDVFMEKVIRFTREEQRTIVRGLYDMRNTMEDSDPKKRELELLILRVIDAPKVEPFWRRLFK